MDVFSRYIHTNSVVFKHAKGMRDIIGLEFHTYHEIFVLKGGNAEFISDSFRSVLKKDSLVVIPKECFHTFLLNDKEENYHRYVLNFNDVPHLSRLISEKMTEPAILPLSKDILARFEALETYQNEPEYQQELRILALLTDVLLEIKPSELQVGEVKTIHPIVNEAIRYIQTNISSISSVLDIANAVNISVSHLHHLFSSELRTSPHRYLLHQRLMLAHRKMLKGKDATVSALECGFANYSNFYKMYKQMFGGCPSAVSKRKKGCN